MTDFKISFGIPSPEKEPKDIREMRQMIDKAGWNCALIRQAQDHARYAGLSGEDEYVLLAYYALRELHRVAELNLRHFALQPPPPIVVDARTFGRSDQTQIRTG